jgi:two-component system, chemotaxis family, chemotaxis protein CheY
MLALVVDDSAAMRHHLSKALQNLGWQVRNACSGVEALAVLGTLPSCDLILTDWHMPGMDGVELCRAVRRDEKYRSIKIVMVTSDAVISAVNEALLAGVDDFVMKPFTPQVLRERLEAIMD